MTKPYKFMVITSFIMLSCLTWGSGMITKAVEKHAEKARTEGMLKGRKEVCDKIRGMQAPYEEYVLHNFRSGCLWQKREALLASAARVTDDKKKEFLLFEINRIFKDGQEDPQFEKMLNECSAGAAAYMQQGRVKERMVSELYFDTLDCPAVYAKMQTLEIKDTYEE